MGCGAYSCQVEYRLTHANVQEDTLDMRDLLPTHHCASSFSYELCRCATILWGLEGGCEAHAVPHTQVEIHGDRGMPKVTHDLHARGAIWMLSQLVILLPSRSTRYCFPQHFLRRCCSQVGLPLAGAGWQDLLLWSSH